MVSWEFFPTPQSAEPFHSSTIALHLLLEPTYSGSYLLLFHRPRWQRKTGGPEFKGT